MAKRSDEVSKVRLFLPSNRVLSGRVNGRVEEEINTFETVKAADVHTLKVTGTPPPSRNGTQHMRTCVAASS